VFLDYSWLTMGTHVFKQHHTQTITCIKNYVCSDIMTAVEKMLKVQFLDINTLQHTALSRVNTYVWQVIPALNF
jgi:hypothetical protein